MDEFFDVYSKERKPLGYTKKRGVALSNSEYHLVAAVWVVTDNGKMLVTRRAHEKDTFPDAWENTSGFVQAGESVLHAAQRELHEETGIFIESDKLQYLGTVTELHAITDTFATVVSEQYLSSNIQLQAEEISDYQLLDANEISKMLSEGLFAEPVAIRLKSLYKQLNAILSSITDILFQNL